MRNTFISVYFHHVSRLGERMEECFVSKSDLEKLKQLKHGASSIVVDIVNALRYYVVQVFTFSRFKAARFSPWDPLVKTLMPEISCEDPDSCDHDVSIWLLESEKELGREVYEAREYAVKGTILENIYGKRGFTKAYEFYDEYYRGVAVCTDSRPTVCAIIYFKRYDE